MAGLLHNLGDFLTTPIFRWLFLFMAIILNLLKYYNEPHRYSDKKAFDGLSYRFHLYLVAVISCISYTFMSICLWLSIPFTSVLPSNWYIYLFILCMAIITQIGMESELVKDNGTFNPPPPYMLPRKYRIMLTYASLIINIIVMLQAYIYFGIADYTKKTILSRYILERYGGWYNGNKLDFAYEWSGLIDVIIAMYILYLQYTYTACKYGLPESWNF